MNDEMFVESLQEICNALGESAEIEPDTMPFLRLLAINCPKKLFEY